MIIGDQDAAARAYVQIGVFLLGALFGVLVLATRASEKARDRGREERRRHAEDTALADERADRHERDIRGLIEGQRELIEGQRELRVQLEKVESGVRQRGIDLFEHKRDDHAEPEST